MNEIQIKTFLIVSRCGSFSGAARSLFLTQPAVTHRIQSLEEELGVTLFDRDKGNATLTQAGHAFIPEAQFLYDAFHHAYGAMLAFSNRGGNITIGFPDVMLQGECNAYLAIMRMENEESNIVLHSMLLETPPKHKEQLVHGDVDLIFTDVDLPELDCPNVKKRVLFSGKAYACMHRNNPLSSKAVLTPTDLKEEKIYWYQDSTAFPMTIREIFAKHGLSTTVFANLTFMQTIPHLRQDGGVAITNIPLVRDEHLKYVPMQLDRPIRIGVAWMENRMTPALRQIIDQISALPEDIWR